MEKVNHPQHYQGKFECIDEMIQLFGVEAVIGFCKCNVYKYKYRSNRKNGEEDLQKADWYMEKLIELQGGKQHVKSSISKGESPRKRSFLDYIGIRRGKFNPNKKR